LPAALMLRSDLQAGESVITADGIWLGQQWLRVSKDRDSTAGVLKRQAELKILVEQIEMLEHEVSSLTDSLESGVASLQLAERDREVEQNRLVQLQQSFSETRAQLGAKKLQVDQVKADLQRIQQKLRLIRSMLRKTSKISRMPETSCRKPWTRWSRIPSNALCFSKRDMNVSRRWKMLVPRPASTVMHRTSSR